MKFYPHHIGDYASATAHLSNEEDICYRRLLDRYYDTELPIENDLQLLARKLRVSQSALENVLGDFFTLIDGRWHNGRADAEIAHWYDKCHKAKQAIEARWAKREKDTDVLRTNGKRNTDRYDLDTTQDPRPKTQEVNLNPLVDAAAPTPVDKSPKIPNCPHQKLVDLFHAEATSLPRVMTLNEARKVALARLWKQVLAAEQDKSTERGLEYFEGYFNFVEQSDFLTGRAKNGKDWSANFDWIIKAPNFVKIIEGTYHRK
jgi:uncharacterized protein YdaU (DUF1376 family)